MLALNAVALSAFNLEKAVYVATVGAISLSGAMIGKRGVEKISQEKFRNVVAFFIFIFGLKLLLFPWATGILQ